jgi:uncharacterized protein
MTGDTLYVPRTYRHWVNSRDLTASEVIVKETDILVRASSNLKIKAEKLVFKYRKSLESYIARHPEFQTSLEPVSTGDDAPSIVKTMAQAAARVSVGPMASVAGAIAEFVGDGLAEFSSEIIIENGGDIYMKSLKTRVVGIFAGDSPLTGKVGLEIPPEITPTGICSSSGTVGYSLSFGRTDATIIIARSAALADAAATALGNMVKEPADIAKAIAFGKTIPEIRGAVIILGAEMGIYGDINLVTM